MLAALYSGHVFLWNYSTQTLVKSFEATDLPVRCAKFIVRKHWIVCGSDDMFMRVYNYNTMEKVREWEAHTDYIRCVEPHPSQPYVLSSSDDMSIKMWDWQKHWACVMTFEGHAHYVMQVKLNPKDTNTFASASLDRSVKVWGLNAMTHHFSLEGHERGVNCVDYYHGGDKPYLLSGADDHTLRIWDYQTKTCVQVLEGHTNNVSACCFHGKLPIIVSASEDGTVRLWHSTTYRLETTLNYGMERAWTVGIQRTSNKVAIGYDEGTIVIKMGNELPIVSMDRNGKVVWAINNDICSSSVRGTGKDESIADGERLPLVSKELGSCEIYPQYLRHNSNGRFVVLRGDGEYIIYTAQALRNKSFGNALDFVWSAQGTGDYAVRESSSRIKTFKNFKEKNMFKTPFSAEALHGGALLGIQGGDFIVFYDWDECRIIRRIDVNPNHVFWSDSGDLVALACDESYYVLRIDHDAVGDALASGSATDEDGVEGAFELLHEVGEKVRSGQWVGDCFMYTNTANRLNYYVGGEVMTLSHLDRAMFLLGYIVRENRCFLVDKSNAVVSYEVLEPILEYQTAVVRRDFESANEILPRIPREQYNNISRFLESQGFKEEALQVADDPDQRFELALQLGKLDVAHDIMQQEVADSDSLEVQRKWKQLGDLALAASRLSLAEKCSQHSGDLSGLLLMYASSGNAGGMAELAALATKQRKFNVAFVSLFLLGRVEECIKLLRTTGRIPEAAFMSRTYLPSKVSEIVTEWRDDLAKVSKRAAESLADPNEYGNLFPNLQFALKAEKMFLKQREEATPANQYLGSKAELDRDLIEEMKNIQASEEENVEENVPEEQGDDEEAREGGGDGGTEAAAATAAAATAATPAAESQAADNDVDNLDEDFAAAVEAAQPGTDLPPDSPSGDVGIVAGGAEQEAAPETAPANPPAAPVTSNGADLDDLDDEVEAAIAEVEAEGGGDFVGVGGDGDEVDLDQLDAELDLGGDWS